MDKVGPGILSLIGRLSSRNVNIWDLKVCPLSEVLGNFPLVIGMGETDRCRHPLDQRPLLRSGVSTVGSLCSKERSFHQPGILYTV